jgi:hypothetical protein
LSVTTKRAKEVASIIRGAELTDEEVRQYVKSLTKKNTDRTPFYDKVYEELKEHGKIHSKDMENYPNAPPSSNRVCRKEALNKASDKLGKTVKRVGKWYVLEEDLTKHHDFFIRNMPMNKATFEANCKNKEVDSDALKASLKGTVTELSNGEMELMA